MIEGNGVCHFEEPCPYWALAWTAEVTRALEVRGGKVQIPAAPAWGVAISPAWLAAAEHRISALD